MNGQRFSKDKARRNGFYLALAVCLVAVGIAAWSTYDAVHGYLAPVNEAVNQSSLSKEQEQEVLSGQGTVSVVPDRDREDPEAPRQSASPEPAKQTAGTVSRTESSEEPESSAAPEIEPEEGAESTVHVNAGALYELSTELISPVESNEAAKAYSAGAPVYSETMKDWRIHTGLDLKAENEEAVAACGNGIVRSAYTDSLLGNVVWIEHGDYDFYYCGLGENFQVKEGDVVTKGQQIGVLTAVPMESAEGPHLHLEVKRDNVYLDPQTVLNGKE